MNAIAAPGIAQPFRLSRKFTDPLRQALFDLIAPPLEHAFGLTSLNHLYTDFVRHVGSQENIFDQALELLQVQYNAAAADLANIPKTGPVITVSNHPFGALDGLILAALVRSVRPDIRLMANHLLSGIPDLHEFMFFVDPFGTPDATRRNARSLRAAMQWVSQGGLLSIFPAGEVSSLDLQKRAILDPAWNPSVARLIRHTRATVVPIFFDGANSALFNLLGLLHPRLRTAMLPRECLNKRHRRVTVQVGSPIPFKKLAAMESPEEMTAYLRLRTYLLQSRSAGKKPAKPHHSSWRLTRENIVRWAPIATAHEAALLASEVAALPPEQKLLEHGEFQIFSASAGQIPHLLHEIGRQREIAFRGVAEGTGTPLDLDRFDGHYTHLFAWNKETGELVGAYRFGLTDEILPRFGVDGLYTHTLFRYDRKLIENIGPALELGRSFVRPEYQKAYAPLMLLWKGIGAFVAAHPRYQVLFGPVTISNKYRSLSHQLIVSFLEANNSAPDLASLVQPHHSPRSRPPKTVDLKDYSRVVRDIDEVSNLVAEIESDHKGIPILLKQYLKLGGKILGFNIDPTFADVLDGLILVDLRKVDPRIVERFAGPEGAAKVIAWGQTKRADMSSVLTKA